MAGKTLTWEAAVLNLLRATNITASANVYVGLYTTNPADDNSAGTEVSGNAYARQLCGFSAPTSMSPSQVVNAADILFPVQTPGNYGTVNGVGVFSAVTTGTLYYWVSITGVVFATGNQAKFAAGQLKVTEE